MLNLGQIAYEAYRKEAGGKSAWSGDDLPTWEAAAQAVADQTRVDNL